MVGELIVLTGIVAVTVFGVSAINQLSRNIMDRRKKDHTEQMRRLEIREAEFNREIAQAALVQLIEEADVEVVDDAE